MWGIWGRGSRTGIVVVYAVTGIAWMLVSGMVLLPMAPQERAWASAFSAIAYVAVTASLLWVSLVMRDRGVVRSSGTLAESEERYRMLAERSRDVVYRLVLDPVPHLEYISPSVQHLAGVSPAELYANPRLGQGLIHPDDLARLGAHMETAEVNGPLVVRWITPAGITLWMEHVVTPVRNASGRLIAVEGAARDVTMRIEAEERGAMLAQAVEAVPVGVALVGGPDSGFEIEYVNGALAAMAGRPADGLVGHSAFTMDVLRDASITDDVAARLADGETVTVDSVVESGRGPLPIAAFLAPILRGDALDGVLALVQDRSDAEGRDVAEARLQAAFDASPLGIVIADLRGAVTAWNTSAERLLGRPAGDAVGWMPPTFLSRIPAVKAGTWDGVSGLPSHPVVQQVPRPDGTTVACEIRMGTIRDASGRPTGVIALMEDMTEALARDEWNSLLRRAIDHAAESIIITDAAGSITYVNPAVEASSGYRADELIGNNPRIFQGGATPDGTYREMWKALAAGKTWRGVLVNRRKDGTPLHEEATFSAVPGPDGRPIAFVGVKRDISMEQRLAAGLSAELNDRAVLEEAIGRIDAGADATETAERICEVVAELDGIDAVWVATLHPSDDTLTPIAARGPRRPVVVGVAASAAHAAYVRSKVADGPWADNFADGRVDPRLAKPELVDAALAAAPIKRRGEVVAVLFAVGRSERADTWIARNLRMVSAIAAHAGPLLGPQLSHPAGVSPAG